jgi:hypothetical protein
LAGVSCIKLHPAIFLLVFSPLSAPFSSAHAQTSPSAAEIIHRSVAVNTSDWKAQPNFSFREDDTKSKIDSSGRAHVEQSKTYEVMMIEGTPYYRLIAMSNEPLSHPQQQQEQKKLNAEIARRQNESAHERQARVSKYRNTRAEEHMLMQEMVAAFTFHLIGEERIEGTDSYVLDAVPNPDYRPAVERAKVLTGMKGRLWIDKARYHWVRVWAEVISPVQFGLFIAKVKPGTSFELDQAPVGDVWLPKSFVETVNATLLGIYGMRTREEEHYSAYHQTTLSGNVKASSLYLASLLAMNVPVRLFSGEAGLF